MFSLIIEGTLGPKNKRKQIKKLPSVYNTTRHVRSGVETLFGPNFPHTNDRITISQN